MKTRLLILAMFAGLSCNAQKAIDKAHFYDLIKEHNYVQLLSDAHKERNKVYGKIWLVDYYIAKASCGLGKPDNAVGWFNSSLKYPNVNDEIRTFLLQEMSNCRSGQVTATRTVANIGMPDVKLLTQAYMPTSTSRGKMGPVYNCKFPPQELTTVRDVSIDELESRLFSVDDGDNAIRKYKSILNSNYHINVSGRFLLITYGNTAPNKAQIAETSKRLERTYKFFSTNYDLRPPDKLLAVYLLPDKATLRKTALLVHGVKIPDSNIGYSNLSDLSLVGVSDITRIGTLCHELFHLMIRTDVGDVPPWMDEGMACIYETSRWNGDVLTGDNDNWRTDVLRMADRDMSDKIPNLNDFLKFTWQQFDGIESNDICKAAINYAYAKHFMLYCQAQGKLPELVTAVKNQVKITDGDDVVFLSDSALLEKVFASTIDTIEKRFNYWLYKTYNLTLINGIQYWKDVNQPNGEPEVSNQSVALPEVSDANANQVLFDKEPDFNNQQMVQQMPVNEANMNALNISQQSLPKYDADGLLNSLTVHVKIDENDKTGNSVAFSYYLEGESGAMDNVAEVNYQRNHESFQEFKSKSFKKSSDRESGFLFKGYQWGSVETVYVYLVLRDGSESATVLKTIVYDN